MPDSFDKTPWEFYLNENGFASKMWLVAYEAPLKGWMTPSNYDYLKPGTLAGEMYKRKISFYDKKRNVTRTKIGILRRNMKRYRSLEAIAILTSLGLEDFLD